MDYQSVQQGPRRLTFRQKFWLFGVGLPVLLLVGLLVVLVFLPRRLNPTEQKLLGRWVVADPPTAAGSEVIFQPGYEDVGNARFIIWCPDEDTLCVSRFKYGDVPEVWARFMASLGWATGVCEIVSLTENELKIKNSSGTSTIVLKRIETANPEMQDSE